MRDVAQVYQLQEVNFEPRWFPMFYLLKNHSPMAVTDIAQALGVTHPAVIQIARDMKRRGLVVSQQDPKDRRIRNIGLSEKGRILLKELEPLWADIDSSAREMLKDNGIDLLQIIENLENAVLNKGVFERVKGKVNKRLLSEVKIIDYSPKHKELFKSLNEEWLKKYFTLEAHDKEQLEHPDESIIKPGGFIWFAELNHEIVGTCALIKTENTVFELAKMAVTAKAQGKQVGKKLALTAIEKAQKLKAKKIVLAHVPTSFSWILI
jgi:DNA-binding MarR family transcriptional regulator